MQTLDNRKDNVERVILRVHPAIMSLVPGLIIPTLLVVFVLIAGISGTIQWIAWGVFVAAVIHLPIKWDEEYWVLTTRRIIAHKGIFSTTSSAVWLQDIRGVVYSHPFWGRIFGYSSVGICTAATAGTEIQVRNIRNMSAFIRAINQARSM